VHVLVRVAAALGGTVTVRLLWQGEGLDRLLDIAHADLTEQMLSRLRALGWEIATEVSFNIRGERGSIDILAFHPATGSLLVIEIKSVVPDLQAMLGVLDRKVRLAADIARERGWIVRSVSRLLVLPDDRTSRRRVDRHAVTFDAVLPARTLEVRGWLAAPAGTLAGVLFVTNGHQASTRHRIARPSRAETQRPRTNPPRRPGAD
jgi:hypothetical protein